MTGLEQPHCNFFMKTSLAVVSSGVQSPHRVLLLLSFFLSKSDVNFGPWEPALPLPAPVSQNQRRPAETSGRNNRVKTLQWTSGASGFSHPSHQYKVIIRIIKTGEDYLTVVQYLILFFIQLTAFYNYIDELPLCIYIKIIEIQEISILKSGRLFFSVSRQKVFSFFLTWFVQIDNIIKSNTFRII